MGLGFRLLVLGFRGEALELAGVPSAVLSCSLLPRIG